MQCQKLRTYMETGRVVFLPVGAVEPNPGQPRYEFPQAALEELAESIRQHGILQPLTVRRVEGSFQLVAGERRLRAAKLAGLTEVPCIVMQMDDAESGTAAMVENIQRQNLHYIEEARGIARMMENQKLSQEQAARLLGKSQSAVANKLRLLRHSPEVLAALRAAGLTERHARALLKLQGDEEKLAAIAVIRQQNLSVAAAEKYIDSLLRAAKKTPAEKPASVNAFFQTVSQSLAKIQQTGVRVITERRETDSQIVMTITIAK